MDSSESSIKTWLKFFMDASIPAGVATEYAISFSDNRMRLDMLPELSRDYLHDLNISVLGDVIAILKHAKSVSQKAYMEHKLTADGSASPSPPPPPPPPPAVVSSAAPPTPLESPVARMVKRLVRKEPTVGQKRCSDQLDDDCSPGDARPAVKRMMTAGRLGTPLEKPAVASKKTVFDRLGGDSQVTSTTPDTTRFRITGLTAGGASIHAKRVSLVPEEVRKRPSLPYHGVLKPIGGSDREDWVRQRDAAAKPAVVTSTLVSDRRVPAVSVRARVGTTRRPQVTAVTRPRSASAGSLLDKAKARTPPAGVKSRLGTAARPVSGSVLGRLGSR